MSSAMPPAGPPPPGAPYPGAPRAEPSRPDPRQPHDPRPPRPQPPQPHAGPGTEHAGLRDLLANPRPAPTPRDPSLPWKYWWWVDLGFALLMVLFSGAAVGLAGSGGSLATFAGELVLWGAVALRTRMPLWSLVLATLGGLIVLIGSDTPTFSLVAVPLVIYSVARWGDRLASRAVLVVAALASIAGPARWFFFGPYESTQGGVLFVTFAITCALIAATPYLVGRVRRNSLTSQAERMAAARERERHVLIEREQQLRMDTVHERTRIARELHDIVAHSLSVIVVQAEGGRALAAKKPEVAAEVLGTIADTSRRSLAEMRSMVRLLRGESDEPGEYVPTPGLGDIPELIHRTGNATLRVEGDTPVVSESVGLTAYRVVQESLTNVLKHAGPQAMATVSITYWPGEITLEIADNGRGAAVDGDGLGNGLRGMRERLELHGGHLLARPAVGGGFVVRARLPLAGATPPPHGRSLR